MNYLDSIIVLNNIFVCSLPNEIQISMCEVQNNAIIVNVSDAILINCKFVKNWFNIFDSFLSDNDFVATCIAQTNSPNVIKFTKEEFKLIISGNHLLTSYSFDKGTVIEIMNAISYMYISSLCLTPQCTLIFNALMCHFEVCSNYEETILKITNLTPAKFLDLIKSIIIMYDLSENVYLISSVLMRHKPILRYLYNLRCYSKKN